MGRPEKLVLIGLDAPIPHRVLRLAEQGVLPTFARLLAEGVFAENCLVPHPTITPPNWTSIVTGAWAGTHGITCFNVHNPGDPLDRIHQGFTTEDCQAEYIWDAAERGGKKPILLNYPSSWPPTHNGIQIGGAGLSINEWRFGAGFGHQVSIAEDQLFSTEEYPLANVIELEPARGWQGIGGMAGALEAPISLQFRDALHEVVEEKNWWLLVTKGLVARSSRPIAQRGSRYETVLLCREKNAEGVIARLRQGEWSNVLQDTFETADDVKDGVFRCKLVELSDDAERLRLYFTPICQLDGWSRPAEIARQIPWQDGMPIPHLPMAQLRMEWIDVETFTEVVEVQNAGYAECAEWLLGTQEWDCFFMHAHSPDWAYHAYLEQTDPATCDDPKVLARYQAAEARFYASLDSMIERIMTAAGEDVLTVITSDHGAVATEKIFNAQRALVEAGLTVMREDPETGERSIDWSKTRAACQRSIYVYVNLKGRDPDGIVEPGDEYEQVRDEAIRALIGYEDPETGERPVRLALRREDARMIGLYGDRVGDVIYGIGPRFGGATGGCHGQQLPTIEHGDGSMRGLLMLHGPGIKAGETLSRTVWLVDIVPTVCYLLGIPVPAQCEGAVIYQALEEPDTSR
jgi:predicted AlkP superfamily phosphohydrolase/phosphomutase